jgi:hypothetical protein
MRTDERKGGEKARAEYFGSKRMRKRTKLRAE